MKVQKLDNVPSYEAVYEISDPAAKLFGYVAIHSTVRGPGCGGTRLWRYDSLQAALSDVLKLSQGMSFKNAMADLPLGGGKAVIIKPEGDFDREALFDAYGRAIDSLGGIYITAEDVGVTPRDMTIIARHTRYVAGLPDGDAASGDPSPVTARGVFKGLLACAERQFGSRDLRGRRVAVQGVGHVGAYLCDHLHNAGAELVVCDVNADAVTEVARRYHAEVVAPDDIYDADVDIFSPCALGGILTADTVRRLKAKVVAGGANNQLADPAVGQLLMDKGVLYAPDYVINGGGIINVAGELSGRYDPQWVDDKLDALIGNLEVVLDTALAQGRPTHEIADETARSRLCEPAPALGAA